MSVTVFAWLRLNEMRPQALARYLALTEPLLDRVGAKVTKRFRSDYTRKGNAVGDLFMLVEYPSREAAEEVFAALGQPPIPELLATAFQDYSVTVVSNAHLSSRGLRADAG